MTYFTQIKLPVLNNQQHGMTLLELIIVATIITIIATIAIFQFKGQQNKGFRGEGVNTLMQAIQEVEACARDRAGNFVGCGVGQFSVSENNRFNITVVSTATSYTVTATRVGGADKVCTTISVNNFGQKSFTSLNDEGNMQRCWNGT